MKAQERDIGISRRRRLAEPRGTFGESHIAANSTCRHAHTLAAELALSSSYEASSCCITVAQRMGRTRTASDQVGLAAGGLAGHKKHTKLRRSVVSAARGQQTRRKPLSKTPFTAEARHPTLEASNILARSNPLIWLLEGPDWPAVGKSLCTLKRERSTGCSVFVFFRFQVPLLIVPGAERVMI